MESLNKGRFFVMIVYNQQNHIADDRWNLWLCTVGWGSFENSSVESDSRDKSDVNETDDQQILWIHSINVGF